MTLPEAENRVVLAIRLILSLHEANQTPEKRANLVYISLSIATGALIRSGKTAGRIERAGKAHVVSEPSLLSPILRQQKTALPIIFPRGEFRP